MNPPQNFDELWNWWVEFREENLSMIETWKETKVTRDDFIWFHYEKEIYLNNKKEEIENMNKKQTLNESIDSVNYILEVEKKEKSVVGKIPKGKQKKVLKLIVEELKKGTQKTDAINDSYQKAGYQDVRQVWTIVGKVEKGELLFNELTKVLGKI